MCKSVDDSDSTSIHSNLLPYLHYSQHISISILVLSSQVHPSYPYGNPTSLRHPANRPRKPTDPSSRALFADLAYAGGGANGALRWRDLREEAARAALARKMASARTMGRLLTSHRLVNRPKRAKRRTTRVRAMIWRVEAPLRKTRMKMKTSRPVIKIEYDYCHHCTCTFTTNSPLLIHYILSYYNHTALAVIAKIIASALSSLKSSFTPHSDPSSRAHSYASASTVSVIGTKCMANTRKMLHTRAIAVRVASSIS